MTGEYGILLYFIVTACMNFHQRSGYIIILVVYVGLIREKRVRCLISLIIPCNDLYWSLHDELILFSVDDSTYLGYAVVGGHSNVCQVLTPSIYCYQQLLPVQTSQQD